MNNKEFVLYVKLLREILEKFYSNEGHKKINTYWKSNVLNKDILIQIKRDNIPHMLGIHYWKQLKNVNNFNFSYLQIFIKEIISGKSKYDDLLKLMINNFNKLSKDIVKKYKSVDFFNFLVERIIIFVNFINCIQNNSLNEIELYYNDDNSFFMCIPKIKLSENKKFNVNFELCRISSPSFNYETYIIKSIKVIKQERKNLNKSELKLKSIFPKI